MRGIELLKKHGIVFRAIAVVTRASFLQANAFYKFFAEQGFTEIGCNYDEAEGLNKNSSLFGSELAHEEFIANLLECSIKSPSQLRIREFEIAKHLIANALPKYSWQGQNWPANMQVLPFGMITVAHNGDFSTFSPELIGQPSSEFKNFSLGNVETKSYLESVNSEPFIKLWNSISRGVYKCEQTCAYFNFCGGGAPVNKLYENGDFASSETLYCRTMLKRPFDLMLHHMETQLDKKGGSKKSADIGQPK
jgi:uncharacterized protein